ncbi:MAG: 50S ribosomal protein L15 [Elusimicrobia bacterium]|nr:50S ribosomal protein L15 [Elusimicrobiota bacterium]
MALHHLKPAPGSRRRSERLGLGEGSGGGQTATRGQKGQRSRSGDGKMSGFEGGQTLLIRRTPKRGFTNGPFKLTYQVVSLFDIERVFKNQRDVSPDGLKIHGLIKGGKPVKILADGDLTQAYKISAHAFSKSAVEKIQKAGGAAQVLSAKPKPAVEAPKAEAKKAPKAAPKKG